MSKLATLLTGSQSKLAGYLTENKIDPARVLVASAQIETLQPEDRAIRLAKRQTRGKDDDAAKAAKAKRARTGRPVTLPGLTKALKGEALSGPYKLRVLRAVARIAEQKKLAAPELSNLF
ncbi:MAG: hypothetical protein Q8S73_17725 [Deltaproteobacteria bacterium]|nr:hypothetical protein [Myxococcales bacterium]MDP3215951.1 hypothetical protein [Deltaproteobacteria bacterium]